MSRFLPRLAVALCATLLAVVCTARSAFPQGLPAHLPRTPIVDSLRFVPRAQPSGLQPVTGANYERKLSLRAFRFRRTGKGDGGHADVYVTYSVEPQLFTGLFTQQGRLPDANTSFAPVYQSRRPKKCKDTGCSGYDSDCRWATAKGTLFQDQANDPLVFCNPLSVSLTFGNDHYYQSNHQIGQCVTDGSSIDYLTSPAPPSTGSATTCDARQIQGTIKGKPAYVEFQWEMKRAGFGSSVGQTSCSTESTYCGVTQFYHFDQPNGCMLHCYMSLRALDLEDQSALGTRDIYFMFDTDGNEATGDQDASTLMCGAEYRAHVTLLYPGGAPTLISSLEHYTGGGWQTTGLTGPVDVVVSPNSPSRSLEFRISLADLGSPPGPIASWMVFSENNFITGAQPCLPCDARERMTLALGTDSNNCPTVENIDDSGARASAPGAVVVTFSAPMQAITSSDLSLSPALPGGYVMHLAQSNANEKLSITVTPEWPPGHYVLTLLPTIKDCSGVALGDPDNPGTCGVSATRAFCAEESHLQIANSAGTPVSSLSFGVPAYTSGSQFPPSAALNVYLVQQEEFDLPNERLVDFSSDGPNVITTDGAGNLPLTNLGIPVATDEYNVVVDMNDDGILDAGDRVAAVCGAGLDVGPPCADAPPDPPTSLWSLDQKVGTLAGERTEGLVGDVTGPFAWITGRVNGALDLQSTPSNPCYVTVAPNLDLDVLADDFSVSAWIRTTAPAGAIVSHAEPAGVGYMLGLLGGVPVFTLNDGSGTSTFAAPTTSPHLDDGDWHLVTVTVERASQTGLHIWSDLTSVLTGDPTARQASITPAAPLIMGNMYPPTGAAAYTGALDEVTLFDVALDYAGIHSLYAAPTTGGCYDAFVASQSYPNPSCPDSLAIDWFTRALAVRYPGPCMPWAYLSAPGDTLRGVAGVVTAVDAIPSGYGFYLQNSNGGPWSGVDVFTGGTNLAGALSLAPGDSVVVEFAGLENYQGGLELTSPNNRQAAPDIVLRKVSAGNPLPPFHVATSVDLDFALADTMHAQQWQGTLVRVNGPLRVARVGGSLPVGAFYVVDPTQTADTVYVDGRTLATVGSPALGTVVDWVQGVADHRSQGTILQLRAATDLSAAAPPGLVDAYPLGDSQIRVVFDRDITPSSGTNLANYVLDSFGTVDAAVMDGTSAVRLTITNGLPHGAAEGLTASGITSLASSLTMTTPQSRGFINGVLSVQEISAPRADSLLGTPCVDKSAFAGGGGQVGQGDPGPRMSFAGVCTGQFGNLYFFEDASPSAAGNYGGIDVSAPPVALVVGRSYVLAGAVEMNSGETQMMDVQFVVDRGAVATPAALPLTVAVAGLATCDANNTINDAADYRSMLIRLTNVVAATPVGTPPGNGFTVKGEAPRYDHSIFVQNLDNVLGACSASNPLYPAPGQLLDVTWELHLESGTYRVCPRNAADVVIKVADAGGPAGPLVFSFKAGPNPAFATAANPVQLSFTLPVASRAELGVFDVSGRRVATLLPAGQLPAGHYANIHWSGRTDSGAGIEPGVYFYRLTVGTDVHLLRTVVLGRN